MKFTCSLIFLFLLIFLPINLFTQDDFPEWAKGLVWYQIFPERFANGDSLNDPRSEQVFIDREIPGDWEITKWTSNWFEKSSWEKRLTGSFRDNVILRRYGGDIQGIIDHLDYLKELGIGAVYFNPLFESISMHKYDATSYHHIDANYGPDPDGDRKMMNDENPVDSSTWKWTSADKLFLKLINEVHKRGMHIVIDGVFNHTGTNFWAFNDIVKKGKDSRYYDWYIIRSLDNPETVVNEFDYKGWWNSRAMPEFNRTEENLHPGPKSHIFGITKRWMDPNNDGDPSDGVDGWRLDVARDVPLGFWKEWRKVVKSINSEAYIVGELWEISSDFVGSGDVFDALMNYSFAFAVNDFFIADKNRISVSAFIDSLKKIDKSYPEETLHILQNLVDSHDTDRLSSMILNPDRKYDRNADEGNIKYNPGKPTEREYNIQKLIAAFQMTYPGAPMIYYGDEVGMWGADDPHDRKPMIWGNFRYDDEVIDSSTGFKKGFGIYKVDINKDLLDFYKRLISIRKNSIALREGKIDFTYIDDIHRCFAFERNYNKGDIKQTYLIAFNLGNKENKISISTKNSTRDLINGEIILNPNGKSEFTIAPNSFRIFASEQY